MPLIKTDIVDHVATIALDHYDKRNALSFGMISEIMEALEHFKDQRARVVILRSALNEKVWSSGHSVDELPKANIDPLPYNEPLEQVLRAFKKYPAPVIAMVHGSVWGGACDLVLSCDMVIADETSSFAITPAKIGLPYNTVGILNFVSQLPLAVVKEMFFTAEPIDAARAERVGLINRLTKVEDLEAETMKLARTIASRSPAAIATFKAAMHALSTSAPINPDTYEYLQGLRRDVYFGPDYREGIQAFLEKRPAKF